MGTEVQSKMHLPGPGYYTLSDVEENVVNGNLNIHRESRASKNGQYMFMTSPSLEEYFGHDQQHMKQTILSHELTFKHQLHELHRVYKRQRDLMNELHHDKLCNNPVAVEMPQTNLFKSHFASNDAKSMSHMSNISTVNYTESIQYQLGTVVQSPFVPTKDNSNIYGSVITRNGVRLEDYESFESRSKKLHRTLFDLEVPADKFDEESVFEGAKLQTESFNIKPEFPLHRDVNFFGGKDVNFDRDGYSSSSNLHLGNRILTDLNEPFKVVEASSSTSVDIFGSANFLKGEVRRHDSFVNSSSHIQFLSKQAFTENVQAARYGCNTLPFNSDSGTTRPNKRFVHDGSDPVHSFTICDSVHTETEKSHKPFNLPPIDRVSGEPQRKKRLFGVDICEGDTDQRLGSSTMSSLKEHVNTSSPKLMSQNLVSIDTQINQEKLHGGLPWLKKSTCSTDTSNEKVGSEMNDCPPSIGKILGVPIFAKSPQSKPSSISSSNSDLPLNGSPVGIRHHIDLNMCLNEEEPQFTAEIALDTPLVLETEIEVLEEGLDRNAAEAIVVISSYHDPSDNTIPTHLEEPKFDSLCWFADIVFSDNEVDEPVWRGKINKSASKFDYFEFMTLKIIETLGEEHYPTPMAPSEKDEKEEDEKLSKRVQRGKARKCRQRKDFQKDVLPSISSLTRHEVTEDFQIIEGIIRTTGGTWQSSLSRKNAAKANARGRRRTCAPTTIPTVTAMSPPQIHQANNPNESGFDERKLTGWGKKTRRLSRTRSLIIKSPV